MFLAKNTIEKLKIFLNCTKIALIFEPEFAKMVSVKFSIFSRKTIIFSYKDRFSIKIEKNEGRTNEWKFQTQW